MKHFLIIFLLFAGISYASAQEVYTSSGKSHSHKKSQKNKKKGYDPDRLILGGGLNGLSYSTVGASAGISLIAGYRILDKLSAGVGIGYQYSQRSVPDLLNPSKAYHEKLHLVYPSVWVRYFVYRNFFVSTTAEYNIINYREQGLDAAGNTTTIQTNVSNISLLPGCGFRIPLGGRVAAYGELRMEVLQGKYSPYPPLTPMVNFGFAAGL